MFAVGLILVAPMSALTASFMAILLGAQSPVLIGLAAGMLAPLVVVGARLVAYVMTAQVMPAPNPGATFDRRP